MQATETMQKSLRALFANQNLAVLATHSGGQPYASLVAFVATDDLKHIYFVTPTTTRKYANMAADSRVAVLVNTSQNEAADFHQALSVTAIGSVEKLTGPEKGTILRFYLAKHPHLEDFAKSPSCALMRVTVTSYYLVKYFQQVMELHITA